MTSASMARALELAEQARGKTRPNPAVGAVLVHGETVVGEGWTQPPGGPHAEMVALERAGDAARGASLYVTLEPCAHWGRTGPCAQALVQAGIGSAHVAIEDPNPLVRGRGLRMLEDHGICVSLGDGAEEAGELVEVHRKYMETGLPFLTLLPNWVPGCLESLREECDVLVTDESKLLESWPGTALFRAPDGSWMARWSRQGGPWQLEGDLSQLLGQLGQNEMISCVVAGSEVLTSHVLSAQLVDKIIADPEYQAPSGFAVRVAENVDLQRKVLYRASG